MPRLTRFVLASALALAASPASAQPGPPPGGPGRPGAGGATTGVDALVERILSFDANKDGALTKSELKDERLHALFGRADADGDGTATRGEWRELFAKENAALAAAGARRGGPMGGPGGPGPGAGGPPPGEFGGPPGQPGGPRGQRPRPGQVLPPGLQDRLELTDDQRRRIDALQEIVDAQLEKILTPEQRQMLNEPGPTPPPPPGDGPPRGEGGGPPRVRPRPNQGDRPEPPPR